MFDFKWTYSETYISIQTPSSKIHNIFHTNNNHQASFTNSEKTNCSNIKNIKPTRMPDVKHYSSIIWAAAVNEGPNKNNNFEKYEIKSIH
jgi:hypothetical protein